MKEEDQTLKPSDRRRQSADAKSAAKQERLKAALRSNLRRRKQGTTAAAVTASEAPALSEQSKT
jgi:hypothetical protein